MGDFHDGAAYHVALAHEYLAHNHGALAQEAAARAIAEAPGDSQVLQDVAALHEGMGNSDRAIAVYERAIANAPQDTPESAALYARLGAIHHRRAALTDARAMYERAQEIAGDDPAVLFELARLHFEESNVTQGTFELLKRIVRLDPERAQAHLLLGDVYLGQKKGSQAIEHYQRACELTAPDSLIGREARGKLGKWGASMPDLQAQGWRETLRRMCGLMLIPALAALSNAGMTPLGIDLVAWGTLAAASVGAYLCVCATDVPRNPLMRAIFGPAGLKGIGRQALVGIPGVFLWAIAFGLILWNV
jgi:tetratricopeptide (TPR) repeat protein